MKKIINFFKIAKQKISDILFKNRYGTVMVFVGIIVAFWDFTTKFLFDGQDFIALNGVFSIFSTHNTGGAWSIFANATWLLIVISILFIAGIVVFNYFLKTKTYFYAISLGLLLSGAVCNLYDRIAFGYVRDFIKLDFINFPIFNIADICICVGVALLAVYFIFIAPKQEKQQKLAEQTIQEQLEQNQEQEQNTEPDNIATENSSLEEISQEKIDKIDIKLDEITNENNAKNINAKQIKKSTNAKKTTTSNNAKLTTKTSNKTTKSTIQTKKQALKKVKTDNAD